MWYRSQKDAERETVMPTKDTPFTKNIIMNDASVNMPYPQSIGVTDANQELEAGLAPATPQFEMSILLKPNSTKPPVPHRLAALRSVRGKYVKLLPPSDEIIKERRFDAAREE